MGTTTLINADVRLRLWGPKVLGMVPCGHGYWYGYIIMLIGMGMGINIGMGMAMYDGKMVGARWCGAHIQKAEPLGTLPFVSSLWWLLKS